MIMRRTHVLFTLKNPHTAMISRLSYSLLFVTLLSLMIVPGSATFALQNVQVQPPGEGLQPDIPVTTHATAQIIPQGSTTFIEGYTMVISTDLDRANWDVVVVVDGRRAAVYQKTGATVFINGYLLSYPTSQDVAVEIHVEGYTPPVPAGSSFAVLRIVELNNQGQPVSGSVQTVSRKLVSVTPEPTTMIPTTGTTLPVTTKAGMLSFPVIGGVAVMVLLLKAGRINRP
jgi:hypothetical protein